MFYNRTMKKLIYILIGILIAIILIVGLFSIFNKRAETKEERAAEAKSQKIEKKQISPERFIISPEN